MQLEISQDLTVQNAVDLKASLLDALAGEGALELDLTGVRAIDLAGLQLLCATAREARARGVELTARGVEDLVHETARGAGFRHGAWCEAGCPWHCSREQ